MRLDETDVVTGKRLRAMRFTGRGRRTEGLWLTVLAARWPVDGLDSAWCRLTSARPCRRPMEARLPGSPECRERRGPVPCPPMHTMLRLSRCGPNADPTGHLNLPRPARARPLPATQTVSSALGTTQARAHTIASVLLAEGSAWSTTRGHIGTSLCSRQVVAASRHIDGAGRWDNGEDNANNKPTCSHCGTLHCTVTVRSAWRK